MENIPFLIFSLLSINNASLKGHNDYFSDYIDLNNTFSVKGIFVWIIFLGIIFNIIIEKADIHMKKYYLALAKKLCQCFYFILDMEYMNLLKKGK